MTNNLDLIIAPGKFYIDRFMEATERKNENTSQLEIKYLNNPNKRYLPKKSEKYIARTRK